MSLSPTDYRNMMKDLLERDSGLTGWEIDFLDSLCDQGFQKEEDDLWMFTEKQLDKLEQIYERVFS